MNGNNNSRYITYEINDIINRVVDKKNNFIDVFSSCLGKMRAIQYALGEIVVKNSDYQLNFRERYIEFNGIKYSIKFIGTESKYDNTWMWGWNNVNNFPNELIDLAEAIRNFGIVNNLDVFQTDQLKIDENFNGHNFSIITCGLFKKNYCYYRIPHEGGAIYVALTNVDNKVFESIDEKTFISISLECIQQYDLNHKIFIESFLMWNCTDYEWISNYEIIANFSNKIIISFDEMFRIKSIKNYIDTDDEYTKSLKEIRKSFHTLKSLKELNLDIELYSSIIDVIKNIYDNATKDGIKKEDIQYLMDFYNSEKNIIDYKKEENKNEFNQNNNLDPFVGSPFNDILKDNSVKENPEVTKVINDIDNAIKKIDSSN